MRVWMVGAEMAPFSKVGGLGDVLGALPAALSRLGCDVTVIIPHLPTMNAGRWGIRATDVKVSANVDGALEVAQILEARAAGDVRVLFVHHPSYFHREGLYGTAAGDFPDSIPQVSLVLFCSRVLL